MLNKFRVDGLFYNQNLLKFRKCLEIKRKGVELTESDLTVVMMNPGSSRPKDVDETLATDYLNHFVPAHPDATQSQIMRIMDNCNLNYAKIINLSDIRTTDSNKFYKMINNELKDIEHSIFLEKNRDFLKAYLNPDSIFLLAWGVDKHLTNLAKLAIEMLNSLWEKEIIITGCKHPNNLYGYYHPLPKKNQDQKEWVNKVSNKISLLKRS